MNKARPKGKARCVPADKKLGTRASDRRVESKAVRPSGKISDVFGFLKQKNGPSLSIEDMNKFAARGWAGKAMKSHRR